MTAELLTLYFSGQLLMVCMVYHTVNQNGRTSHPGTDRHHRLLSPHPRGGNPGCQKV